MGKFSSLVSLAGDDVFKRDGRPIFLMSQQPKPNRAEHFILQLG